MPNTLFITNDLDRCFDEISTKTSAQIIAFRLDDFKIEDARELIAASYVASEKEKLILVRAKTYNEVSQNALLKILEEPPELISIGLIGSSSAAFLPTIRSRMPIKKVMYPAVKEVLDFDFEHLGLAKILEFLLQNKGHIDKNQASAYIDAAVFYCQKSGVKCDENLLNFFHKAKILLHLNSNAQMILTNLFLKISRLNND